MSLHLGHTVMLMDRWTAEGALERIERYRVTSSHMAPTMFNRLLQLPDEVRSGYDVSSLRAMSHAAAPCPIETKRRMIEWWGDSIWEYYAATEGGGTSVSAAEWTERPGTVGRAWSGCATASAARSCPGRSTTSERGLIGGQSAGWSFPLLFASLTGRSGHGPAPYGPGRPSIRGWRWRRCRRRRPPAPYGPGRRSIRGVSKRRPRPAQPLIASRRPWASMRRTRSGGWCCRASKALRSVRAPSMSPCCHRAKAR